MVNNSNSIPMKRLLLSHLMILFILSTGFAQTDFFDAENYKKKRISERLFNNAVKAINAEDYYGALFFLDSATLVCVLCLSIINQGI